MKILLLDNSSLTPLEDDYCLEPRTGMFAKELLELDNDLTIFGQIVNSKNTVHTFKLLEKGFKVRGVNRRKNKIYNYILLYLKIIPYLLKNDFVYIFYPSSFRYVALMCKILRRKYGIYIRGSNDLNDRVAHRVYKGSFVTFTVTDYYTDHVKSITNQSNVFSIRPMIPYGENDLITNRIYSQKNKYKILFLGRIVYNKGIVELINAVDILGKKGYNLELDIVGDGEFIDKTKKLVTKLGLDDNVNVVGSIYNINRIKKYYSESDIFILPTYYPEGFPRTLYEAMIFGTPIITTFVSSIPAIMKDDYNCKQIKVKSVDSLVEKLSYAMDKYIEMGTLAKNATSTVRSIFISRRFTHAEHLNEYLKRKK